MSGVGLDGGFGVGWPGGFGSIRREVTAEFEEIATTNISALSAFCGDWA
jgi:hypothetical protein